MNMPKITPFRVIVFVLCLIATVIGFQIGACEAYEMMPGPEEERPVVTMR